LNMNDSKKITLLSWMLFLLSLVCSLCLGIVMFTIRSDGDLPFELRGEGIYRDENYLALKEEIKGIKREEMPIDVSSINDEVALRKLSGELLKNKKMLEKREKDLEQRERALNATLRSIEAKSAVVREMLDQNKASQEASVIDITNKEGTLNQNKSDFEKKWKNANAAIAKKTADTLAAMKAQTAMSFIYDLEVEEGARLLDQMEEAKRSEILSTMVESTKIDGRDLSVVERSAYKKRANELLLELGKAKYKGVVQ